MLGLDLDLNRQVIPQTKENARTRTDLDLNRQVIPQTKDNARTRSRSKQTSDTTDQRKC